MKSKIVESPAAAVADIADGASIVVGGFGVLHGWPSSVLAALRDRAVRDLTLICNTPGFGPLSPQILADKHQVKKLVASFGGYPYRKTPIEEAIGRGEVEFELVPQGTLAERLRAGGAGLAGFFTPTGVGTDVERGKEVREFDGRRHVFERALTADVSVVRAHAADPAGNLVFRGSGRNFHPVFATAGRTTIAEVDELVGLGDLDPEHVVTPGIFVDRVVRATLRMTRDEVIDMVRQIGRTAPDAGGLPGIPPDLMAMRAAALFARGSVVNLGIGLPTLCSNYVAGREIMLHAENGFLNYGPFPEPGSEDVHLYNAGGQLVTALPGAAFTHTCDAFAMARGGRVDTIVLGGFQVAENGDLANWKAPHMSAGGVGGAMDLAAGRAELIVLMYHTSKDGQSKLLRRCNYPLTAIGCVSKIVTNLALIEVIPGQGFFLREVAPGIGVEEVQRATEAPLRVAPDVREMRFD
ncbi:MAG: 3-oxoacid CoA-transferase subunit B [Deltaproteobacteria bacterium]|nr:3-oxoacid CoA-transferase subunit B [Deltaproteobacteria bacterium]